MQSALAEAQRGDETQVEIASQTLAAKDTHGKTRCLLCFNVENIKVLGAGDAVVAVRPGIGRLREVLVVFNRLDGIAHLVESQKETKMIRLLLVFGQVGDNSALGLCGDDRCGEQKRDSQYFQCFFQDAKVLNELLTKFDRFYCAITAAKLGKKGICFIAFQLCIG